MEHEANNRRSAVGNDFDAFLSGLAIAFVGFEDSKVDAHIGDALADIGRYFAADRCFLNQFSLQKESLRTTHMWEADGIGPDDFVAHVMLSEQFPWYTSVFLSGKDLVFDNRAAFPAEASNEVDYVEATDIQASAIVPLIVGGEVIGNYGLDMIGRERTWRADEVARLRTLGAVLAAALGRKRTSQRLDKAFREIAQLRDRLQAESVYLQEEIHRIHNAGDIVGDSGPIQQLLARIGQVAPSESTVLLLGETGTGKELVARAVHAASQRAERALVKVDCTALPPTLVESELFGHEKGAFTGAGSRRQGRFEIADGGTIFLDEIGELAPEVQAKLLRVLQDGEFERVGSNQTLSVDVRVIAATNRDLVAARREGHFRDDLFYRLNVFPIVVPPLREHREDVPMLTWYFVGREARRQGKQIDQIGELAMRELTEYAWPGNVRELQNVIERAVVVSRGPQLMLADALHEMGLAPRSDGRSSSVVPTSTQLIDVERHHIHDVLRQANWKVSGRGGAAERLGLNESTLRYRMRKHGIKRPGPG